MRIGRKRPSIGSVVALISTYRVGTKNRQLSLADLSSEAVVKNLYESYGLFIAVIADAIFQSVS